MKYYVYAYLRKDGTPYYIGKGIRGRAWHKKRNVSAPQDKNRIVIVESNLAETDALLLEIFYIKLYGRKNLGTGILWNLTDGGEGTSGRIYSEETRRKISINGAGKGMLGKKHSEEAKHRMSEGKRKGPSYAIANKGKNNGMYGKRQSEETKQKIGEASRRMWENKKRKSIETNSLLRFMIDV